MTTSTNAPTLLRLPSESQFTEDITSVARSRQQALKPVPRQTVSEWADTHRILPSHSAEPGPWRTSRTPFLREIMDCLSSHHPCEFVVVMKGAQLGATECGNNWIGYTICNDPGLMLVVNPSLSMIKRNTNTRLDPLIESTPSVQRLVAGKRSRDPDNSTFRKAFPGGELVMTGSNSAAGLRSIPARYLLLDEVDAYPGDVEGEGDPLDLAFRRTVTFRGRRKILEISTPTEEATSRINKALEETDYRRYFLTCRGCGHQDYLRWECITWDRSDQGEHLPETARWECSQCHHKHYEQDKPRLLAEGTWQPTKQARHRAVGFHLPGLYSPFESWADQVSEFLKAQDDERRLKVWVNTVLGETWKEKSDTPDWEYLYARRERYTEETIPAGGLVLTAGVDVQLDRLEVEVVAWGPRNESWSVAYRVIEGYTASLEDDCWSVLDEFLHHRFRHTTGTDLTIRAMAIDEGYNTHVVREWAWHPSRRMRVIATKGSDTMTIPIGLPTKVEVSSRGKRLKRGMRMWPIGVSYIKEWFYGVLQNRPPTDAEREAGKAYPDGYCHFPQYGEEFFRMLTAEQLTTRIVKGYPKREWVKVRDRNEALDCRVYNIAVAHKIGLFRWPLERWNELAAHLGVQLSTPPPEPPTDAGDAFTVPVAPAPSPPGTRKRVQRRRRRITRSRNL